MRIVPFNQAPDQPSGLPTPVEDGFRGIALHWLTWAPPTDPPRKRRAPTVPVSTWVVQRVVFKALSPDGSDVAPSTNTDLDRYLRGAYVITASHHPIPSQQPVYYEVRP